MCWITSTEDRMILPIKTWFKGCQGFNDDGHVLAFVGGRATPKLVVEKDGRPVFDIFVDVEVDCVEASAPVEKAPFFIVLQTSKSLRANQTTRYFSPGSKEPDGAITFEIDTSNYTWSTELGYNVVQHFRAVKMDGFFVDHLVSTSGGARVKLHLPLRSGGSTQAPVLPPVPPPTTVVSLARPVASRSLLQPLLEPSCQSAPIAPVTNRAEHPSYAPPEDDLILVYPPNGKNAVNITRADVDRLQPGQLLNDTIIEFALKLWLDGLRDENPELAEQTYVFSSFFYQKLKIKGGGYGGVRKWTQNVDLFKKRYVIVPINECFHWYLAIIYQPECALSSPRHQPTHEKPLNRKIPGSKELDWKVPVEDSHRRTWIFIFDSLNGSHPDVFNTLQEYLRLEAVDKKALTTVTQACWKKVLVPTQTNYSDCGIYLVHFVQAFMMDPESSVNKILTRTVNITAKERADDWREDHVKLYRQYLIYRVNELREA